MLFGLSPLCCRHIPHRSATFRFTVAAFWFIVAAFRSIAAAFRSTSAAFCFAAAQCRSPTVLGQFSAEECPYGPP